MLEFANRNAEMILQDQSRLFSEGYLANPATADLIFSIAGNDSFSHGYPVAPSTISVFAIKRVMEMELSRIYLPSPSLPEEIMLALNNSYAAGMMTLDLVAFMKFCAYQTDPERMVNQMVNTRIFDKSIADQMLPYCRPLFPRLKDIEDEELIDMTEDTMRSEINQGRFSPSQASGIDTMCRVYRQTYPYAKSFRAEETRKLFGL